MGVIVVVCATFGLTVSEAKTETISYGAGNAKFLKSEIEWISDFGRTTASQHKIIQGFTWTAKISTGRDGTGGKLTVDPPFSFRRERGTGKI